MAQRCFNIVVDRYRDDSLAMERHNFLLGKHLPKKAADQFSESLSQITLEFLSSSTKHLCISASRHSSCFPGTEMSSQTSVPSLNGSLQSTSSSLPLNSPKMSALTEYNSLDPDPSHPSFAGIPKSFLLPDGYPDYLRLILTSRVYEITQETPLTSAINLSAKLGVRVVLKREDLQPVFSFKIRGAYNRMANIPEDERWKGVVACSAGIPHTYLLAYTNMRFQDTD